MRAETEELGTGVRTRDRKEGARQEVATNKARKNENSELVAAKMFRRYKKTHHFQEFKEKGAFVPIAVCEFSRKSK